MPQETRAEVGYIALIRANRDLRNLWLADVVSLLGDWFNTIALYAMVEALTGSPAALALIFIVKMGTYALASPLAGVLADRHDRRRLMIGADLLRAVVVLGFLTIDRVDELGLLYTLIAAQIAIGSVFRPARSASVPNITRPDELVTANTLMAATWSSLLTLGAALGGLTTAWLGVEAVFVIDAATYLVSAALLMGAHIPSPPRDPDARSLARVAWSELGAGWRYLWRQRDVARLVLSKAAWASGGGAAVYMLTLLGARLAGPHLAIPTAIGLLLAARGLGSGVGPILARAAFKDSARWPLLLGRFVIISGATYACVGAPGVGLTLAFGLVLIAHALSGANWVLSTILLQTRTDDRFRGRVFAAEWVLVTLINVAAISIASLTLERAWLSLNQTFIASGAVMVLAGALYARHARRHEAPPTPDAPAQPRPPAPPAQP